MIASVPPHNAPEFTTHSQQHRLEERVGVEMEWRGGQPPPKPPFVPKPPKRGPGKLKRAKISKYNWESARDTLGVTHHLQVYSAAIASTTSIGNAAATATTTSPVCNNDMLNHV